MRPRVLSPRKGMTAAFDELKEKRRGREELELELETVVGQAHPGGQGGLAFRMQSEVSQVGEPGLFCPDILGHGDGLGDGEVGGMGFVAQAVDDEDGNIAELGPDGGRDGGAVGQIGSPWLAVAVEPESGGDDGAVGDGQGDEGDRAKGERTFDAVGFGTDVGGVAMVDVKGVIKSLVEAGEGVGIGVDGDAVTVFHGVGAEVIEAGK